LATILRRLLWDNIHHPSIQFLVALLLDSRVCTADYLLQRVRHTKAGDLPEELLFYFLPEWSTCQSFFELQIESNKARLAKWDAEHSARTIDKLDGRELASDDFMVFKRYRSAGRNHNSIGQAIAKGDVETLKKLVDGTTIKADSELPYSLFERYKPPRKDRVTLVEYAALLGQMGCFTYLVEAGGRVTDRVLDFSGFGGSAELIRAMEGRELSFKGLGATAMQGYHVSVLRYVLEVQKTPLTGAGFMRMCNFRYKGLHYLLQQHPDFDLATLLAEIFQEPIYNALLLKVASCNDLFLSKILIFSDGFNVMLPTNLKYSTALHAAAAHNAIDILPILLEASGVDPNANSKWGTPLICAVRQNAWEAVELLIQTKGVNVNVLSNGVWFLFSGPL
jgi:hypothetical protein